MGPSVKSSAWPPITAILVSADYGAHLAECLPHNKKFFSDFIVVTSHEDEETKKVCSENDVRFITTDIFWKDSANFNKAAGMNVALKEAKTDYICALDADALLPGNFEEALQNVQDPNKLYGMNRATFETIDELGQSSGHYYNMPPEYIIGFFQLFNVKSKYFPGSFPEDYKTAGFYDTEFTMHWPAEFRSHLSRTPVAHIGKRGVNWRGVEKVTSKRPASAKRQSTYSDIIRITYLKSSRILCIQNVGLHVLHHIRVTFKPTTLGCTYRFTIMQVGNYVELPADEKLVSRVAAVQVSGINHLDENFTITVPLHIR